MRAILVVLGTVVAVHAARAETVVVMSDPAAELESALRVVMTGRGIAVTGAPLPPGGLRLERAAVAQRTAMQIGADAAVWIDDSDVCAVTADGYDFRHAPFPREAASPRAFAAIATSLLDEMIRPEPWAQGFDVNIDLEVTPHSGPRRVATIGGPVLEAPGLVGAASPLLPAERAHQGQTMIEVGPMLSPLTIGLQGAVSVPASSAWRLGANAAVNATFDGDYVLGVVAGELRHVGAGHAKHWDLGIEAGYATDGNDPVAFAGFRIARTWEMSRTAVSLGITPLLLVPLDETNTPPVFPGIYTSLRWQVPL